VTASRSPDLTGIYHLDAKFTDSYALAEGFNSNRAMWCLSTVPLVLWNRVVSLILPSAAVVGTTIHPFK
jgi:polysaccharide export outer membrane protein